MKSLLFLSLSLIWAQHHAGKPVAATLLASSSSSDWRAIAPENTLYMDLKGGRVIIELTPDFAPRHVANIKALAKEKFWDGLAIVRLQDNYVAQWGDPDADKPDLKRKMKKAQAKLQPEFDVTLNTRLAFTPLPDKDVYAAEVGFTNSFPVGRDVESKKMWLLHCYGMVGAGRDTAVDSGSGAELYAVIGHAPRHLDRNVTVLGRVIQGIDVLSSMPRGRGTLGFYEKPEQRVPITSVRLGSDVPKKERVNLEILRTDTPLFKQWIEARRNRHEDWFHHQAGRIDACNILIPVREKK